MMASMIFSPLVGYGFFLCSFSHAFRVAVDSLVAFFLRAARSYPAPYLLRKRDMFNRRDSGLAVIGCKVFL